MTREEAIKELSYIIDEMPSMECAEWIEAISMGIKALAQEPPVYPQPKRGRWILVQRGPYIDINCSECGYTRVKEYAYNYTIDEIDIQEVEDLVATSKMNYCECCGAKMQEVSK